MTEQEVRAFIDGVSRGRRYTSYLRRWYHENSHEISALLENKQSWLFIRTGATFVICNGCGQPEFSSKTTAFNDGRDAFCPTCSRLSHTCPNCNITYRVRRTPHRCLPRIRDQVARVGRPATAPVVQRETHAMVRNAVARNYTTNVAGETGFHRTPQEDRVLRKRNQRGQTDLFRYLGVELEVEPKAKSPADIARTTAESLDGFAILKRDSSLSDKGFEIVSAPATLRYHLYGKGETLETSPWDKFFQGPAEQLLSYDTHNCGLHVHVARASVSPLTLARLLLFMNNPENREFLEKIAGRPLTGEYAQRMYRSNDRLVASDIMRHKVHRHSCPWSSGWKTARISPAMTIARDANGTPIRTGNGRLMVTVKPGKLPNVRERCFCGEGQYDATFERHSILNLNTHKPTFEFRMFRGTTNRDRFFANVEFCAALTEFCTEFGGVKLEGGDHPNDEKFGPPRWDDFTAWASIRRRKAYRNLVNFLLKNALCAPIKMRPQEVAG